MLVHKLERRKGVFWGSVTRVQGTCWLVVVKGSAYFLWLVSLILELNRGHIQDSGCQYCGIAFEDAIMGGVACTNLKVEPYK